MKTFYTFCMVLFFGLLFSSCGLMYSAVLGVKQNAKWTTRDYLEKRAKKLDIPLKDLYQLDTASLRKAHLASYQKFKATLGNDSTWNSTDSVLLKEKKGHLKDNLQPVHVRYFDKNGAPIYWMINCYVDPILPKMNWNIDSSFNFFPPRPFSPLNDSLTDSLSFFLPHIRHVDGSSVLIDSLPEADYYVLILWNDIFKRPSKELIELIHDYHKKHAQYRIHTFFVSNQNAYLWPLLTPEQREIYQNIH